MHGWKPFEFNANTTNYSYDLGANVNTIFIKNNSTSVTAWIRIGATDLIASTSVIGANPSYPLAPGEEIEFDGILCRYIAAITASGTAGLKGIGYLRRGILSK